MLSYNSLQIENFSELSTGLSTCSLISFQSPYLNVYSPSLDKILDLSAMLATPEDLSNAYDKISTQIEVVRTKAEATTEFLKAVQGYLEKNFSTRIDVSEIYCTIEKFNQEISKIETMINFKARLSDCATIEALETAFNKVKNEAQYAKTLVGTWGGWKTENAGETGRGYKTLAAGRAYAGATFDE